MTYRPKPKQRPYRLRVADREAGISRDDGHGDAVLCPATTKAGNPCKGLATVTDPDRFCPGHIKQREAAR